MSSYELDIYNKAGLLISLDDFARLHKDMGYRAVGKTSTPNGDVSTVWLGMSHGMVGGSPIIFETMIFGGLYDGEQERYCTEDEAKAGHLRWIGKVQGNPLILMELRQVAMCAKCSIEGVARSDDRIEAQTYFKHLGWTLTDEGSLCQYCSPELPEDDA
jgi:hypothetical protein